MYILPPVFLVISGLFLDIVRYNVGSDFENGSQNVSFTPGAFSREITFEYKHYFLLNNIDADENDTTFAFFSQGYAGFILHENSTFRPVNSYHTFQLEIYEEYCITGCSVPIKQRSGPLMDETTIYTINIVPNELYPVADPHDTETFVDVGQSLIRTCNPPNAPPPNFISGFVSFYIFNGTMTSVPGLDFYVSDNNLHIDSIPRLLDNTKIQCIGGQSFNHQLAGLYQPGPVDLIIVNDRKK